MIAPVYINSMASIQTDQPDVSSQWIKDPMLRRRMSGIVRTAVTCALQCMEGTPSQEIDAIITGTGLGCLADTQKFMDSLLDNHEQALSPTPFIQSTFNTVAAQIAMLCNNQSYNMNYTHQSLSFESALIDGMLRLAEGDRNVLVGAFDELTPTAQTLLNRLNVYRYNKPGAGAQFFILSKNKTEKSMARMAMPQTNNRAKDYLAKYGLSIADIDLLINDDGTLNIYSYGSFRKANFPDTTPCEEFKKQCGEYQTASSFALWRAVQRLNEDKSLNHILVHNAYNLDNALILISRP